MISYCSVFFFVNNFSIIEYDFLTLCYNMLNVLFIDITTRLRMCLIFRSIDFRHFSDCFSLKIACSCQAPIEQQTILTKYENLIAEEKRKISGC